MTNALPINFDEHGLVPVVVQDTETGDVLMMAFMNQQALEETRRTGRSHFWSRSRDKLWRKGETSGHGQIVDEILINCDQNSVLLKVHQIGAVCHDGYSTCYYRSLEPDNSLAIQRDRVFDPASVYGNAQSLESLSQLWFDAFHFLLENDLSAVSETSKKLQDPTFDPQSRIGDELRELAGVIDGSHTHGSPTDDALLEGSQILYWLAVSALYQGLDWNDLRPDRALETASTEITPTLIASLLSREAERYAAGVPIDAPGLHATIALVGQACQSMGIEPRRLLLADIAELRSKPYLSGYFENRNDDFSPD
jgi:phosphoribosyl-AMP cyclohydrolase